MATLTLFATHSAPSLPSASSLQRFVHAKCHNTGQLGRLCERTLIKLVFVVASFALLLHCYKRQGSQMPKSAYGDCERCFGASWGGSPETVSCRVWNPVLGSFPGGKKVCTVQETLLGLSAGRPQLTSCTHLKHIWACWLFWRLYQGHGISMLVVRPSPVL